MVKLRQIRVCVTACSSAWLMSGCAPDSKGFSPQAPPAITAFVSGAALAALGKDGRFAFAPHGVDTLTEQQAVGVSAAFLDTFGPPALQRYQFETGIRFSLSSLRACGRPYLSTSSYEPLEGRPIRLERRTGPHWLVVFCTEGLKPVIAVSVSALATELAGRTLASNAVDFQLGDFLEESVRPDQSGMPVSPEVAVKLVSEATGSRVNELPLLVQPPLPYVNQLSRWRLALERPARVRGDRSGEIADERVLYFGWDLESRSNRVLRAVAAERMADTVEIMTAQGARSSAIHRRMDLPSRFEAVKPERFEVVP